MWLNYSLPITPKGDSGVHLGGCKGALAPMKLFPPPEIFFNPHFLPLTTGMHTALSNMGTSVSRRRHWKSSSFYLKHTRCGATPCSWRQACRTWWACLTASPEWWNCWLVLYVCVCIVCAHDIDSMRLWVSVRVLELWVCPGLPIKGRPTRTSLEFLYHFSQSPVCLLCEWWN